MRFVGTTPTTSPSVTHIIPGYISVSGVTSLGDDVFVMRGSRVEVYDAATFTLQRCLEIPGLGSYSYGLAVCACNKCLYASDWHNSCVHRVELLASNATMKWSVENRPAGLTMNSANNLIVLSKWERKLQEFTTCGTLLRNIQLQTDIEQPVGVVEVCSGKFAVSYEGSLHRVCLVDVNVVKGGIATILGRYGGHKGSGLAMMNHPRGLAIDKHGNILIADSGNNRLFVLNHSLTSAHNMSVSVDGGLNGPSSLWYDKSRGRLYVGAEGRVVVIDHVKDFTHGRPSRFVSWCGRPLSRMLAFSYSPPPMGAGTWGAGWATAHPGKNQGGHGPPWKY